MAIIDYTSLKKIPYTQGKATNITAFESIQEGMTPPYRSDQCGAYALVAATATLGLFPVQEPLTLELKYPFGEF